MKVSDHTLRGLTGYRLQRATGIAMMRYKAVFAEHGLRRTTFSCLSLVIDSPGLRQSQLGETLAIERPNLVKIIEDLTNQGLVEKHVATDDRRAYSLRPTHEGVERFQRAMKAVRALDAEIAAGLDTPKRNELHDALDRIERNAAAYSKPERAS